MVKQPYIVIEVILGQKGPGGMGEEEAVLGK
jgi:hypothetical protein